MYLSGSLLRGPYSGSSEGCKAFEIVKPSSKDALACAAEITRSTSWRGIWGGTMQSGLVPPTRACTVGRSTF